MLSFRSLLSHGSMRRSMSSGSVSKWRDHYGAWIDGSWVSPPGLGSYEVEDPARRVRLCSVVDADEDLVKRAVDSGRRAFEGGEWRHMDVRDRANVLNEAARRLRMRVPEFAEVSPL